MSSGIEGKVAIVTGAGQGVGQGIAIALAKAGAKVMLAGKTESKLKATQDLIAMAGGESAAVTADVANSADIGAIVDATVAAFGGVDILINNAQQAVLAPFNEIDDAALMLTFETGPFASFRMMKAVYPHMKKRGGGAIINFASSTARNWDTSGTAVYSGAKEAARAFTRAAASEWGPDNIRVNTIAPLGGSPSFLAWLDAKPEGPDAYLATVPLRRIGDPENDIGAAVLFLVGPAAGYITGATIPVDGGQANWN